MTTKLTVPAGTRGSFQLFPAVAGTTEAVDAIVLVEPGQCCERIDEWSHVDGAAPVCSMCLPEVTGLGTIKWDT